MSEKTKTLGAGMILSAIFVPVFLAMIYWIGAKAAQVPELEATFKLEIRHLNESIKVLTETAKDTNKQLKSYTEFHAANLARITESLVTHKYRLIDLEKDCVSLKKDEVACKRHILLYEHKKD